jgi:hypothetical protein
MGAWKIDGGDWEETDTRPRVVMPPKPPEPTPYEVLVKQIAEQFRQFDIERHSDEEFAAMAIGAALDYCAREHCERAYCDCCDGY